MMDYLFSPDISSNFYWWIVTGFSMIMCILEIAYTHCLSFQVSLKAAYSVHYSFMSTTVIPMLLATSSQMLLFDDDEVF